MTQPNKLPHDKIILFTKIDRNSY